MLSHEEIYEDVITKLVACISKTNRKDIRTIKIRYLEREGLCASAVAPDKHPRTSEINFFPRKSKMILTSLKLETEIFKKELLED